MRSRRRNACCSACNVPIEAVAPIPNVSDVTASMVWCAAFGGSQDFVWPEGSSDPGFGGVSNGAARICLCRGAQGSRGTQAAISWR